MINIICIDMGNGTVAPIAWSNRSISNKEKKRIFNNSKNEIGGVSCVVMDYRRLYSTKSEAKLSIPQF